MAELVDALGLEPSEYIRKSSSLFIHKKFLRVHLKFNLK